MTACVECGADLQIEGELERDEIVICPECGAEHRVASVRPLELLVLSDDDPGEGEPGEDG